MPNISDYKQANSNIASVQGGSSDAKRSAFVIGAQSGRPTFIPFQDVRNSMSLGSGTQVTFFDHFVGNLGLSTPPAPWSEDVNASGTAAGTARIKGTSGLQSGQIELATGTDAQNDHITLALGTHWVVGAGQDGWLFFETNVQLDVVTDAILEVGLSDAVSETAGLAFSDHSVAGVTDVATDAVVLAFDSAEGTTWLANVVNNGTPQASDTNVTVSASNRYTIRIEVSDGGDVYFYVNNNMVASFDEGVAVDATLGPWISAKTLSTGPVVDVTANIDYISIVGDNAL